MCIRDRLAGVSFIAERKVLLGAVSLDLFAVLLGGATALLPMFAKDILHVDAWGLGLLRGAPAVGALVMSVTPVSYTHLDVYKRQMQYRPKLEHDAMNRRQ